MTLNDKAREDHAELQRLLDDWRATKRQIAVGLWRILVATALIALAVWFAQ